MRRNTLKLTSSICFVCQPICLVTPLKFAFFNGLIAAALVGFLKQSQNGGFLPSKERLRGDFIPKTGVHSTHWAPK